MSKFESPFPAGRSVELFFVTRVVALLVPLSVGMPLAAFTSACLPLRVLLLLSVGIEYISVRA